MSPRLLTNIIAYQLVCVAVVTVGALVLWPRGAAAVLAGGALMAGNFWFLRAMVTRLFKGPAQKKKLVYGLLLVAKFVGVLAIMAILVLYLNVDPLGLALGMSTLFGGVTLGMLQMVLGRQTQTT